MYFCTRTLEKSYILNTTDDVLNNADIKNTSFGNVKTLSLQNQHNEWKKALSLQHRK